MKKIIILLQAIILVSCLTAPSPDKWEEKTPESQGVSSLDLKKELLSIKKRNIAVDRLVIIKNGYKILDAVNNPYRKEIHHNLYSCTKSMTSLLVGIAMDKGYIESVDTPVKDFFPDYKLSSKWDNITIYHLLTMSAGMEDWINNPQSDSEMFLQEDWLKYIFKHPPKEEPGKLFAYNNRLSYLLGAIIYKTTGETPLDFAQKYLFSKLGIESVIWHKDGGDFQNGAADLKMTTSDMAKIGQLVLNRGRWNGEQIISGEWIKESTTKHIDIYEDFGYGYQWWIQDEDVFYAEGILGQFMVISPKHNFIIAMHSSESDSSYTRQKSVISKLTNLLRDKTENLSEEDYFELKKVVDSWGNSQEADRYDFTGEPGIYSFTDNIIGLEEIKITREDNRLNVDFKALNYPDLSMNINVNEGYKNFINNGEVKRARSYINNRGNIVIEDNIFSRSLKVRYELILNQDEVKVKAFHNMTPYLTRNRVIIVNGKREDG